MKRTALWCMVAGFVPLLMVPPAWAQWGKALESAQPQIAVFQLHGPVTERPVDDTFSFAMEKSVSLKDLVARMKEARDDDHVKAVVLMLEDASMGLAQIEELRQALGQIRAADKEVFVHVDELSLGAYALLSGASHLSMVPTADLWLTGLHGESPYLRGLLDKIGVTPDFMTCGAYKSAAEILTRTGPSREAEEMTNWLLDSLYETVVQMIAEGRKVPAGKVREWIDGAPYTAEKAAKLGIIDTVQHRQGFVAALEQRFGKDVQLAKDYGAHKGPEVNFSSPLWIFDFFKELMGGVQKEHKNAVGIVYVDGPIMLGSEQPNPFGPSGEARSTSIRKALDEAADDDTVKAVVLRIDSPGGSAVASEIILDATRRVKAKKPFVVSMGNVAGSGGYYVACGADTLFADASTITGSIGVVGGKLATTAMWNKVGITWKEYTRGANAAIMSSARTFSEQEKARLQTWMDEIYTVFKGHVLAIRGQRLTKDIEELAGGRVYTGRQALELGLVDKMGTLDDAVKFAAAQANLGDYEVRVIPEPKNLMEMLVEELSGGEDDPYLSLDLGSVLHGRSSPLLEAAWPWIRGLDPQRLTAVLTALKRLEMLHQEGLVLMMPEIMLSR